MARECTIKVPMLRYGDEGECVKTLQMLLVFNEQNVGDGGVSGFFDRHTDAALKSFQQDNGLKPTGIANAETWTKLIIG